MIASSSEMSMCLSNETTRFQAHTLNTIGVISLVYAPVIIILNALLITSFVATKQALTNASNILIVCLSLSDALIGAILMPLLGIKNILHISLRSCSFDLIAVGLQFYFCAVSLQMTTLLAFDRYLHMKPDYHRNPSRFSKLFKKPTIYITICLVYVLTGLVMAILFFTILSSTDPDALFYFDASFTAILFLSLAFLVVIYIRGYLRIRGFVVRNPIHANREDSNPEYLKQLFKTVLILLVSMLVAWTPIFAFNLILIITYLGVYINPDAIFLFAYTSTMLFNLNAAMNALIVLYRNKKSREWLARRFSFCRKQRNEVEVRNSCVVISNISAAGAAEIRLPHFASDQ